jgi:putative ABC transport system permease protein
VTGVLKNIPGNSHLQFDLIEPLSAFAKIQPGFNDGRWDNFGWYTYVKYNRALGSNEISDANNRIDQLYASHERSFKANFFLQAISDIHSTPGLLADVPGITDRQYVYIFGLVGIFIIAVACINFTNLATARSAKRAKEVGLRKVAGAVRQQLILQFLSESVLISMAALILSFVSVLVLVPQFDDLTGKSLSGALLNPALLLGFVLVALITGLLAGAYPALFLSRFVPSKVLKGELADSSKRHFFRNALVIVQFSITIMMLVGTFMIIQQMKFISNRNIGYDKEDLLCIPVKGDLGKHMDQLKTLLESYPATSSFSIVSQLPTNLENGTTRVDWDGKDTNTQPLFPNMFVDENFVDVFKMKLISGRSFSGTFKTDSANFLVNEEALKVMDMTSDNAIGKRLSLFGVTGNIVGVVKNFNFKSALSPMEPMILARNRGFGFVVVRVKPEQLQSAIDILTEITKTLNPQYPFTYSFLDEDFIRIYKSENRLGKVFTVFTAIGLIISCLGLYGLSSFLTERRVKEIGVRKVLGASILGITWLLSKTFIRPIIVAIVIASPIAGYGISLWLQKFAYHIELSWEIFAAAFCTTLLVALLTVSYQTLKASLANPARSLRSE